MSSPYYQTSFETSVENQNWEFWVDRGGTFTDIVARAPTGEIHSHKLLSVNPESYDDAALQGIRDILGLCNEAPLPGEEIDAVKMGTTVATNALLERKGDRTLLVVTKGFRDQLRIAYQARPKLFEKKIVLPEMLYCRVEEVVERIDANDNVLIPLDLEDLKPRLISAFRDGICAIAIVLMHGYRVPAHEKAIAKLAEEIGFTQISASYQTSPMIKFVARGDTTVADAYLSPILRRYVGELAESLNQAGGTRLQLMQSNGGLTDAELFQGKDAILSGPAGGIVGAVKTAKQAGFEKVITFDMGGTSTDVAHYSTEFERIFDTIVAGVRINAPMLLIHTVAAGGGSVCRFRQGRFQVGPESSGADPGPTCYRRGGPLSVTDCNVMLGKLQPKYFPSVFGSEQDQPLDESAVRDAFDQLAVQIELESGILKTVEEIAGGFLQIAVENMANAIKKISVQRGYDLTEYVLQCFGGAGGQHACLIADTLGMKTVLIHPLAGVLSAYGMGLADVIGFRERSIERKLDPDIIPVLRLEFNSLTEASEGELKKQKIKNVRIKTLKSVHLRYDGSDTAISVPFGSLSKMVGSFETAYKTRFGFLMPDKNLIVSAISVESIGKNYDLSKISSVPNSSEALPVDHVECFMNNSFLSTPVYQRDEICSEQKIQGPALIVETTGTNVIEPGWQAEVTPLGNLILKRVDALPKMVAIGTDCDPVMLEIFNNLFMSIAEQMGYTLQNTALSVNVKERLDFSCAVFDSNGALIANAPHMPVHLGSMGESVRAVIRSNEGNIRAGDSFALNNPYNGGTHLPDITVITPLFDQKGESILFFVASRGHHPDVGGTTPGSAPPDSCHIEEEGVLIDNFKLVDAGIYCENKMRRLLESAKFPARNVDQNIADLRAQLAANERGINELRKMIEHFGLDVVIAYMGHVQDNAEESVRRVVDVLKNGNFRYEMDNGQSVNVTISINKEKRSATLDFTGTSLQGNNNFNSPAAVCRAAVLYVFRTLVSENIPMNEGCLKPIEIILPDDCMLKAKFPAAVIAGNVETSQVITDTIYGALGMLAASQGTMNNFFFGNETYQYYETLCGGSGAGPGFDGTDAVHTHMTNSRLTDPEVLEWRYPVLLEKFEIRRGSGGDGLFKGGDGVHRRLRFLENMTAVILANRRRVPPYGVDGGESGACGANWVERKNGIIEKLTATDLRQMEPGDIFVIETPGGGGFGKKISPKNQTDLNSEKKL